MNKQLLFTVQRRAAQGAGGVRDQPELVDYLKAKAAPRLKKGLESSFSGASPDVKDQIAKVDLGLWDGSDLQGHIEAKLRTSGLPEEAVRDGVDKLQELKKTGFFDDPLKLDTPIKDHPLLQTELLRAKVHVVGDLAGIDERKMEAVLEKAPNLLALHNGVIAALVKGGTLAEAEAKELGAHVTLYRTLDENPALVQAARKKFPQIRQLATLDSSGWQELIKSAGAEAPTGLAKDAWAADLSRRYTNLFPTEAILSRVIPKDPRPLAKTLAKTKPEQAKSLARRYAGLGFAQLIADTGLNESKRAEEMERRLNLLGNFWEANSGTELLDLDYSPDSEDVAGLKFEGLSVVDQKMVLGAVKGYKRAFAITNDAEDTVRMVQAGYTSAMEVTKSGPAGVARDTGIPAGLAGRYAKDAESIVTKTAGAIGTILGVKRGGLKDTAVSNLDPAGDDYLGGYEDIETLFGSQAYCRCEHCQSILSPAAYFVDLMKFVEENVTNEYFTGEREDHPLSLRNRRRDLWTLPLTCENTNKRIPTLDIVNEILENYIARDQELTDRQAVEAVVYQDTLDVAADRLERVDSFRQPFNLPLLRIDTYLMHFGKTRADVADALGAEAPTSVLAALGFSRAQYLLVTQPHEGADFLRRVYELGSMSMPDQATALLSADFDAQALLKSMGVSRDELGALTSTDFVNGDGPAENRIRIYPDQRGPESLQNDVEWISRLSRWRLDRLHRFGRLRRALPWSIGELDLVLEALGNTDLADLEGIVTARRIQERLGVSVEELCGLLGKIPQRSASPDRPAFADRRFNLPFFPEVERLANDAERLPSDSAPFLHPALRSPGGVDDADPDLTRRRLARLLAGLSVSDEDLVGLIRLLASALGAGADGAFVLNSANLTLLYRHARLAGHLRLSVEQLFRLIGLADAVPDDHVANAAEVRALLLFHDWWKTTPYSLDDLRFITGAVERWPGDHPTPAEIGEQVVREVAESRDLFFADTVMVHVRREGVPLGVTEEQSRRLIRAYEAAGVIEAAPGEDAYRLSPSFNPTAPLPGAASVNVPGVTLDELRGLARILLLNYHASEVLPNRLAGRLGLTPATTKEVLALIGVDLAAATVVNAEGIALVTALQGGGDRGPLDTSIEDALPLAVLLAPSVFDGPTIQFIRQQAALFELTDPTHPGMEAVRRLSIYRAFADSSRDVGFASRPTPIQPNDLQLVLLTFDPATGFLVTEPAPGETDAAAALTRVLRADRETIAGVAAHTTLPATALEALQRLRRCLELARHLGVGGETLPVMLSDEYRDLQRAASAVLAAFRAKYRDEATLQEKLAPFEDIIRSRKRDALVDHLTRQGSGRSPQVKGGSPDTGEDRSVFKTNNNLFHHFLIDVDVDSCRTTSRLVAAISSVQLYVQRCLTNLEHDRHDPAPEVAVPPDAIPANRWGWRKHYRTWEANRKVFLWPCNYLISALRDDMTPIFKEMEPELLQEEVNDQTVLDAYAKYMTGFEEVAGLRISGAYLEGGRILHLLGVAPADPPVHYYRTVEGLLSEETDVEVKPKWSAWQKIDVSIPARAVTPVLYRGRLHAFWTQWRTRAVNYFDNGTSHFSGYKHKISIQYSSLRLDGSWTAPQALQLYRDESADLSFAEPGVLFDHGIEPSNPRIPLDSHRVHSDAKEDYTLAGPNWEKVYLGNVGRLFLVGANWQLVGSIDMRKQVVTAHQDARWVFGFPSFPVLSAVDTTLSVAHPSASFVLWSAFLDLILDSKRVAAFFNQRLPDTEVERTVLDALLNVPLLERTPIGIIGPDDDLQVIPGSGPGHVILQHGTDSLLIEVRERGSKYRVIRVGTTLVDRLAERLFVSGVDGVVDTGYQESPSMDEGELPIEPIGEYLEAVPVRGIDFTGPYGVYYREIFFYIPLLVGDYLNSQQQYAAADRWYRYLFDPTATGELGPDRVWRYREFRGLGLPRLITSLTDPDALAAYEDDPFNPWAIARGRLTDFQLAVVMRYIDNLLDWGDSLFSQFTMESVNEAMLLFVMAADILGERPPDVGPCTEEGGKPWTYQQLGPLMDEDSRFLMDVEVRIGGRKGGAKKNGRNGGFPYVNDRAGKPSDRRKQAGMAEAGEGEMASEGRAFLGPDWKKANVGPWSNKASRLGGKGDAEPGYEHRLGASAKKERSGDFARGFIRQLIFCIPPNKELLSYWDRVEGQLFKIRHCMDIEGVRRQLELFAPEIDPRLLVRMQAAGLSLEDVLNATSGDLPPYRFTYLVEKAKSFAATCQSFGAALESALEKKDAELATQLRLVHEQNLLKLTTQVKKDEIKQAEAALAAMERQLEAAEHQRAHYRALIDEGLIPWEDAEATAQHISAGLLGAAAIMDIVASALHLVPQVGSPLAMKYGGVELGSNASSVSALARDLAGVAQAVAGSTGLEARNRRRAQEWGHAFQQAEISVRQLKKELEARRIALEIANRSLETHEKSIEQTEEVFAQLRDKASGLGLLTWLCAGLHRTFRSAFNAAYSLAKLTEQALRFERGDDVAGLSPAADYFDPARAGLLAPEKLLLDLQRLELRFIETNHRKLEIEQSFSLRQLDPAALIKLREEGICAFGIPEFHIHRFYPGVYRAETKMVRLTVPCVTGPFTNVSATLTLLGSQMRRQPPGSLGPDDRIPQLGPTDGVPLRRSVSIATSTAQNDGGVFELGFRDERYMPFEGSGVVSTWELSLPQAFRPFDYRTISDVIIRINYTAQMDERFRGAVEAWNSALERMLLDYVSANDQPIVFSLRHEFPNAFSRLVHSPPDTQVRFEITRDHFPFFLGARALQVREARLLVEPVQGETLTDLIISVDGTPVTGFRPASDLGKLPAQVVPGGFVAGIIAEHTLVAQGGGNLADKLRDVGFYLRYRVVLPAPPGP